MGKHNLEKRDLFCKQCVSGLLAGWEEVVIRKVREAA